MIRNFSDLCSRVIGISLLSVLVVACASQPVPPVYSTDTVVLKAALAQGADPNLEFKGWRPLNVAVFSDDPRHQKPGKPSAEVLQENVRLLLAAGADPNAPMKARVNGADDPPLAHAVVQCRPEMVRLLLAGGADPYIRIEHYGTVLIRLAMNSFCPTADDQYAVARALLDHVERVDGREAMLNYVRTSPPQGGGPYLEVLPSAAVRKFYGVLAALIEKRVDLDQKVRIHAGQGREWTALHLAEAVGNTDIAAALRRAGARDDVLGNRGESPADVRGIFEPKLKLGEVVDMATKVASNDLPGLAKKNADANLFLLTTEINISNSSWRYVGGPRKPTPGWTGLEDAIRKARATEATDAGTANKKKR